MKKLRVYFFDGFLLGIGPPKVSLLKLYYHGVAGQFDTARKCRAYLFIVHGVAEMGEYRTGSAYLNRGFYRLVDAEVRGMRPLPERSYDEHLGAFEQAEALLRDAATVGEVSEVIDAKAEYGPRSVFNPDGDNLFAK